MFRELTFFALGAALSWLITADHYGHILRGDPLAGIVCRAYGLDTVREGAMFGDQQNLCADLSQAIPEQKLFDEIIYRIKRGSDD